MRRGSRTRVSILAAVAAAVVPAAPLGGCGWNTAESPLSPVVSAESEAGARARTQDQRLLEERQQQEANLRRRRPKLPAGE